MKGEIRPAMALVAIVVVVVVIALVGFRMLGSTHRDVTPQEQIKMMQNMKNGNK